MTCDHALAHIMGMHGQRKFGQQHGTQPAPLILCGQQNWLFQPLVTATSAIMLLLAKESLPLLAKWTDDTRPRGRRGRVTCYPLSPLPIICYG